MEEANPCNHSAQRDMDGWQEHVSLAILFDFSPFQFTRNAEENFTQTARALSNDIKESVTPE
jgi:hypothetical protein